MGLPVTSHSPSAQTCQVLQCGEFSVFQGFAINPEGHIVSELLQ